MFHFCTTQSEKAIYVSISSGFGRLSFLQDLFIFIRYHLLYVKNDHFDISEGEKLDGYKRVSKSQNAKGPKII